MPNDYFVNPGDLVPGGLAKARDLNDRTNAVDAAFDKLPDPYSLGGGLKGFTEPVVVGEAVEDNHAVNRLFVETASAAALAQAQQALADTEQALADTQAQAQLALNRANAAQNSAIDTSNDLAAAQATEEAAEDEANRAQLERINAETATGQAQIYAESAEFWANQAGTISALGLDYKGPFDAAAAEGEYPEGDERGDFYIVQTAGEIDGVQHNPQDWIVYDGAVWDHYPYGGGSLPEGIDRLLVPDGNGGVQRFAMGGDRMFVHTGSALFEFTFDSENGVWGETPSALPAAAPEGGAMHADGQTLVIGDTSESQNGGGEGQDTVYVRDIASGGVQYLTATDWATGDYFGGDVAVDGDWIIVGAWGADLNPDPALDEAGGVYIFQNDGEGGFAESQFLRGVPTIGGGNFGKSVAISGGTFLANEPNFSNGGAAADGAVYVFTLSEDTWSQHSVLTDPSPAAGGVFGEYVAIAGDIAAVGCPGRNGNVGAVHLYRRSEGSWSFSETLTPAGDPEDAFFGRELALDGTTLVVGAPGEADSAGAAYIYDYADNDWTLRERVEMDAPVDDFTFFGGDVGMYGGQIGVLSVGETREDTEGVVYLYEYEAPETPEGPIEEGGGEGE